MKEKLMQFIESIGSSPFAFEQSCGLSRGTIQKINNGIRTDKLADILRAYPQLNPDFLLGLSDVMLRPNMVELNASDPDRVAALQHQIDRQAEMIADYQEQVSTLIKMMGRAIQ